MKHEETGLENRLKEYRVENGWSQEQLAQAIGVSRKTVNTIERARFTPSAVLALKIAAVFECQVEDVFSLTGFD